LAKLQPKRAELDLIGPQTKFEWKARPGPRPAGLFNPHDITERSRTRPTVRSRLVFSPSRFCSYHHRVSQPSSSAAVKDGRRQQPRPAVCSFSAPEPPLRHQVLRFSPVPTPVPPSPLLASPWRSNSVEQFPRGGGESPRSLLSKPGILFA
jgi:hypothetical protein